MTDESAEEAKVEKHGVCRLPDGKWCACAHGAVVADLAGAIVKFDSEADARAFLEEGDARAASVDA